MKQSFNLLSVAVIALVLTAVAVMAQTTLTGTEIIQKVYDRPAPLDQEGELTMILTNASGDERIRKIKQFIRDFGKEEKKIMFFLAPADVRNTSFMNWSYDEAGRDDDQWIYLPALKKVKRISSDSKSDYFMGSDFTYDDLGDRHPSDDSHTLLREEAIAGEQCYVVESTPTDPEYMYSRTVTWIIKDKFIGLKKEFYDEDGEHLKTLSVEKYQQSGKYWFITDSRMHNVQKDHSTDMQLSNLKIDQGVEADTFSERIMKRGN
jgi:outer membrane lipoprotein-sorting protein